MDDAAVCSASWKCRNHHSPDRRVDQRALVRTVDVGRALREHDALFIGSVDAPRTKDRLPSLLDAARRREDVVPAVALVQLRTLERRVGRSWPLHQLIAVDDDAAGVRRRAVPSP